MTDARLLATNPEDSSLVPVACNSQGRLLTTTPVIEGVPNDLEVQGDLDVTGSVTADGNIISNQGADAGKPGFIAEGNIGQVSTNRINLYDGYDGYFQVFYGSDNGKPDYSVDSSGGVTTTGRVTAESVVTVTDNTDGGKSSISSQVKVNGNVQGALVYKTDGTLELRGIGGGPWDVVTKFENDGSVSVAGGKAGFTAEGNLYCTTQRGDLVVLNNSSAGFGEWVEFTPPSRRDQLGNKLQELGDGVTTQPVQPEDATGSPIDEAKS